MRSSNPALSDRVLQRSLQHTDLRPGYGAPAPDAVSTWTPGAPAIPTTATMTVGGAVSASAVLLLLLVVAGWFGWQAVEATPRGIEMPPWLLLALFGGLGIAILTIFKPNLARFTAPLYAVVEGLLVGAISHLYEFEFDGIVLNAVGLTVGVFGVMLLLYATRIIKVTDKLRMGIACATGAIFLVYMFNFVLRLFGSQVPFLHDATPLGIGISLVIVGVAAFNLLLDFDFIERGAQMGAPKHMEWYGAFGLLVTLIWLYLELLRLLSKLQRR